MGLSRQKQVFFFHAHKCAGTSFVRLFANAGRRLPENALNGLTAEFAYLKHGDVPQSCLINSVRGAGFFATEWRVEQWMLDYPAFRFTVIREPWERFRSNYFYDRSYPGKITDAKSISEYRDSRAVTQPNYYTQFFGRRDFRDCSPVTIRDFDRAMATLEKMDAILVLGIPDSYYQLESQGIKVSRLERLNSCALRDFENVEWYRDRFIEEARYDYRIWEYVSNMANVGQWAI